MDDEAEEGRQLDERRVRLGMPKAALAREAKVSRTTLRAILAGEGSHRSTIAKVRRALDRIEHEVGMDLPPVVGVNQETMTIEVPLTNDKVARVTVPKGADPRRVAEQVQALMDQFEQQRGTEQ